MFLIQDVVKFRRQSHVSMALIMDTISKSLHSTTVIGQEQQHFDGITKESMARGTISMHELLKSLPFAGIPPQRVFCGLLAVAHLGNLSLSPTLVAGRAPISGSGIKSINNWIRLLSDSNRDTTDVIAEIEKL